ncbi:MAG: transcriptional regulator [Betaproteobacteria bacterium RIFCSPLOWO2_12_FULL_62_13b]|nr:MAG: transcriptional regulator [Betaproteobacteria bacterium RIFCSPLOWO2_12_FULL_62_13b]
MFDRPEELLEKIRLGEDSLLELKEVRFTGERVSAPHRDGLADELAAFANSRGGVCVLGVGDKARKVMGIPLERLDRVEEFVRTICNDSIDPPLTADIERLMLPTAEGSSVAVIKIDVPRSLFVHQSPGGYLRRLGSSRRRLAPELLARLFQERSQTGLIRFDEQIVADATMAHLDGALWRRFRSPRSRDRQESFLSKLGLARQDDGAVWRPTVTGVLIASRAPRRWLPNAYVQAVAYRGVDVVPQGPRDVYQLDAKDIEGPVDEQIVEACRFVVRNMKVSASKAIGRRDRPQFDMTAIFEALVNAVAHRDYSVHGSKIRLRLFADRIELYSPGALANTLDIESLPFRQAARNETLASMLARCPVPDGLDWLKTDRRTLMDRRGEGVRIILENSKRLSGRQPVYRLIDEAELCLTIFAAGSGRARRQSK